MSNIENLQALLALQLQQVTSVQLQPTTSGEFSETGSKKRRSKGAALSLPPRRRSVDLLNTISSFGHYPQPADHVATDEFQDLAKLIKSPTFNATMG